MRADTCCDCGAPQADRHAHSASDTWHWSALLFRNHPFLAEVDDGLCGDSISASQQTSVLVKTLTRTRRGPMSCDVSPKTYQVIVSPTSLTAKHPALTLKIPPVQKVQPKTSFSAHAMLGSRRPPPFLHARPSSAYFETCRCARATKNHLILSQSEGCTSPAASRAFQSAAACTRAAQAASSCGPSVPDSREVSSFQRSVACKVRW